MSLPEETLARMRQVLRDGLGHPERLGRADAEALEQALADPRAEPDDIELIVAALAATFYARADLASAAMAESVTTALARDLPETVVEGLAQALEFALFTPAGRATLPPLLALLRGHEVGEATRSRLLLVLRDHAFWRPDWFDLDGVLALADSLALRADRELVLDHLVETLVFHAPESFDEKDVARVAEIFEGCLRLRYIFSFLAASPKTEGSTSRALGRETRGRFPHRERAAQLLVESPFSLLVVVNSKFGQGDELSRVVPLLQALLEANPTASVTVLSRRPYLLDHERIREYSLQGDASIDRVLAQRYDGVFAFFEPKGSRFNWRPQLQDSLLRTVERQRYRIVLFGDHLNNQMAFPRFELGGEELAAETGLDEQWLDNVYEPSLRLLAELGLPMRFGEEPAASASVLVGRRSRDAEQLWVRWLGELEGSGPIALMNPFGGAAEEKGYTRLDFGRLADEMRGLVAEGFRMVLLPNGTPWGSGELVTALCDALDPEVRRRLVVAPDPADPDDGGRFELRERPELPHADRVMRLFKYLAASADLIVTVEGWMSHLAYNLAQPFRVIPMAQLYARAWIPRGRGPNQRLATGMSPLLASAGGPWDRLATGAAPPYPRQARKSMLRRALVALGELGEASDVELLQLALASPDPEIRIWVIDQLAREPVAHRDTLVAAVGDGARAVRAAAAQALLRGEVDCTPDLGAGYSENLRAHVAVARGDWPEVERLGVAALPALAAAARDRDLHVRREAQEMVEKIFRPA